MPSIQIRRVLVSKYLETGRLTLALLQYNSTQHTLSLWLSQHSPFSSIMLLDRWHSKEGVLYLQAKADHRMMTCVLPSREFLNITRFFNLFITNSRVLHKNIFSLPCGKYYRKLPCILLTFNMFDNYRGTLQTNTIFICTSRINLITIYLHSIISTGSQKDTSFGIS